MVELPNEAKKAKSATRMLALGYDQTIAITFISEAEAKLFGRGEPLALANPLSEEAGYMRTSLLPGLLNQVSYNLNRGTTNVRLFEVGEVFQKTGDSHDERRHLAFAAAGDAIAKSVRSSSQPYTFFHVKGDIEELLSAFQSFFPALRHARPRLLPSGSRGACCDGWRNRRNPRQLHPEQAASHKLRQEATSPRS